MRRIGLVGLALVALASSELVAEPAAELRPIALGLATASIDEAEAKPRTADSHLQQARALTADGEHTRALAEQTKAIALEPMRAASYKDRAQTWALKHQCELAVADFSRAIEINPRDVETYYGRAACYRALGQHARAADDLTLLLRFNPRAADAFKMRAHVRLAQGEFGGAVTDLRWAIDLDPRDVTLLSMLGYTRYAMGDYTVAANSLLRSLRFRDDIRAMLFLYLARARSRDESAKELEKHAGYLRTRAWPYPVLALYLGRGTPESVLAQANSEEAQCTARFYVGEWLSVNGRRAEGFALLRQAAHTCPKTLVEYEVAHAELRRTR